MAQSGFHGIVGLTIARAAGNRQPDPRVRSSREKDTRIREWEKGLRFGAVLGSILPDADLLSLAITFLFDAQLAMRMHRTATHSLLFSVPLILLGWLFLKGRAGGLAVGFGLGAVAHSALDILVWFSSVDLFWPLGNWGLPSEVNLWRNVKVHPYIGNFLGAVDYLAFALYFTLLADAARRMETDVEFLPRLRQLRALNLAFFVVYTALSLVLSRTVFDIAHYALFVLVFFPVAVYVTIKMRNTIEGGAGGAAVSSK